MSGNVMTWARARFQVIAPRAELSEEDSALPPSVVRRGLRLSVVEGSMAAVYGHITGSAFVTGLALLLGANALQLGVLGALPFLSQLFQFVGAYLQEQIGERRKMVTFSAIAGRSLWGVIAVLPFIEGLGAAGFWVFLLLLALSHMLNGIAINGWVSWMSDLVPARQRGAYFGFRNTICTVAGMSSTWLAGKALDMFLDSGSERTGYLVVFGGAAAFAVAAGFILWRQPEPPITAHQKMRLKDLVSVPLRNARFRPFCIAGIGWALATGIAAPFFNAYGIENLKLSMSFLALTAVVTSAVTLFTQPLIGRLQDRYGDKRVLVISVLGVILLPWGWVLATPTFLLPLWATTVLSGVFWPGINQGLFNLLIDRSAAEGRGAYIAAHGVMSGVGTFGASLIGGALASALAGTSLELGAMALGGYAVLFALSSLGRAAMAIVFWRML